MLPENQIEIEGCVEEATIELHKLSALQHELEAAPCAHVDTRKAVGVRMHIAKGDALAEPIQHGFS